LLPPKNIDFLMFIHLEEITTNTAFVSEVTLRLYSVFQVVVTFRASAEYFDNPIPRLLFLEYVFYLNKSICFFYYTGKLTTVKITILLYIYGTLKEFWRFFLFFISSGKCI